MQRWLVLLTAVFIGTAIGIGAFTFVYAEGFSYMTDDPAACANCHIMEEQYSAWMKSSHRSVAVCNDCHTPNNLVAKYVTKARNGFWHSYYFTLGGFHEPIQPTPLNREIAEAACRDCHTSISEAIHAMEPPRFGSDGQVAEGETTVSCTQCHTGVGHWTR